MTKVGGAEVQQMLIASELVKLGYQPVFALSDEGQPAREVTEDGITLVRIARTRTVKGLGYPMATSALLRAMKQADADIYYQRSAGMVTGLTAMCCRLMKRKFISSVASNLDLGANGGWLSGRDKWLHRYGLTNADRIVVQTEDQRVLLKEAFGVDGVFIRSAVAIPKNQHGGRGYVLWIGGLKKVKRPEMFAELAAKLPEYKFVMVGGKGASEEESLHGVSEEFQQSANLNVVGFVPYDRVGEYYDGADLLVNTSLMEGFPNTYLEAMSRGFPVIGTFDPDGLLSTQGLGRFCANLEELVVAVRELKEDSGLRDELGKLGIEYVAKNHSAEVIGRQYDRLFMELHNGKTG